MVKKYILLKDCSDIKKGAIIEEECEEGNQDYVYKSREFVKFPKEWKMSNWGDKIFGRNEVEKQPDWFERIETVEVSAKNLTKVKKFIKELK